jgi:hypothetical protein
LWHHQWKSQKRNVKIIITSGIIWIFNLFFYIMETKAFTGCHQILFTGWPWRGELTYEAAHGRWWPGSNERAAIAAQRCLITSHSTCTSLISGQPVTIAKCVRACVRRAPRSFTGLPGRRVSTAQTRTCLAVPLAPSVLMGTLPGRACRLRGHKVVGKVIADHWYDKHDRFRVNRASSYLR